MTGVPFIENDFLICPVTVNPALDRRHPMLNGGGRTITGEYEGVSYRSPWCRHSWPAQQRSSTKGATNTVYFGCRGYVQGHELADDLDCGYVEQGIYNFGVQSIQVLNPAWGGIFIDEPSEKQWVERAANIKKKAKSAWPEADEDIVLVSPTTPGSPNKAYYAGRLGSRPSSPSKATSSMSLYSGPPSPSKGSSLPLYRPAPSTPATTSGPSTQRRLRPSGSNMSLSG